MADNTARRAGVFVLTAGVLTLFGHETIGRAQPADPQDVFAGFDLGAPETGPFPSDIFTVPDAGHNTGRRVVLPYPDCTVRPSDCETSRL